MLAIKNIIKFNSSRIEEWNDFLEDIENTMERETIVKLDRMGFPENWRECLTISLIARENKVI